MRKRRPLMNQINVVPYIDVMLVLLVIFMVTAPMQPTSQIDLPSVGNSAQAPGTPLEIIVRGANDLALRDRESGNDTARTIGEQDLLATLRQRQAANPEQGVVIAAEKSVRYEYVMQVMDLLQRNDIRKVGLLVKPAS